LYATDMPYQLQHLLLQLRCFHLKLANHVSKWGGRGAQAVGPECGQCHMHAVESESHVLFECPAYADLRILYGIPRHARAAMSTGQAAHNTARFVRAGLHRRLHGVDTACSLQVVWWVVVILVLISLGLTLLGPWTPTGSV
jgi:hypothetical protein